MSDPRSHWWKPSKENGSQTMGFGRKVALECLVLALCLFVIGFLMQDKMTKLLNSTMEQAIARQTADFSLLAEERFRREFAELHYGARYLETHPDAMADVVAGLGGEGAGWRRGLLALHRGAVVGDALDAKDFPQLPMAFSGNDVVDYCAGKGLLFAVPVFHGDNVRYVLYRMYGEEELTSLFGLEEYDANSRILIRERYGQLVVPYAGYGEKDREFFADPVIRADFDRVRKKLFRSKAAAVYSEGPEGRFFLFGADLPQTNCSMIGYVPWDAVAGDISRIYMLVLLVVSLLLMLFALASAYLFLVQAKVAESDALREAKDIADRASESKSRFLAQMSHEIRTPINAVLGMNEMILRESGERQIQTYARKIESAGQALISLVSDILDFSKIESGHMELTESSYQLDALLDDVMNIIEPRAGKKGLEFQANISSRIPNELWGDSMRIRQIVLNLLTNAVKYTPSGSVKLWVSSKQRGAQEISLQIRVTDTGIGIRKEDQDRLFRDFERLDAMKNRNIEGTGLGLVITQKLLELMRGNIHVESVYGEGSSFSMEIPQRVMSFDPIGDFNERLEIRRTQGPERHTKFTAPDARALVVDDNEVNLFVVQNLLKETQMQVVVCASGQECLERMAKEHFDVVLLDHMMPEMDGIETLRRAREMTDSPCRNVPVIALTANAVSGAREMFLAAGFQDYITKPISGRALEETLLKHLPREKVQDPAAEGEAKAQEAAEDAGHAGSGARESQKPAPDSTAKRIDQELGLTYSGGMKEMYAEVLAMFSRFKDDKKEKMCAALAQEDWKAYTTFVHALKSTALTIGCKELSEQAKALEMAGKKILAADGSQEEREQSIACIHANHAGTMDLYDAVAEEAEHLSRELHDAKELR